MPDLRISGLTDGSPAVGTDEVPVSRTAGAASRRVTVSSIRGAPVSTKTGNHTLTSTDGTVLVNAAVATTMTLPAASGFAATMFRIKNINVGVVTVARTGADLIDGATSRMIGMQWMALSFQSNGVGWYIL